MREYDAARTAASTDEAIQFTIVKRDGQKEIFTCDSGAPAMPLLDLAANRNSNELEALAAIHDFLTGILIEDDVERFKAVARKERLSFELLMQIITDVVEEMSGRPTERPSSLQDGPSPTGASSKVISLSTGAVREVPADSPAGASVSS